jgi:chromosome partitioning protein
MSATKILAIANQKGGVGKTTTAVNLSAALARLGNTVLLVDLDCQANATGGLGLDRSSLKKTVHDLLVDKDHALLDVMVCSSEDHLLVVPANADLLGIERKMDDINRHFYLSDALKCLLGAPFDHTTLGAAPETRWPPDYVIIDCPPALEVLTVNAMVASDAILVPVQAEYYALEGLADLLRVYSAVKSRFNPELTIEGVLITMSDSRTRLSVEVESELRTHYGDLVFETIIPRSVRFGEAPSYGQTIFQYAGDSKGAEAYLNLAKEIIQNESKRSRTRPIVSSRREESGSLTGDPEKPGSGPSQGVGGSDRDQPLATQNAI